MRIEDRGFDCLQLPDKILCMLLCNSRINMNGLNFANEINARYSSVMITFTGHNNYY
jgi:hypothetical protein